MNGKVTKTARVNFMRQIEWADVDELNLTEPRSETSFATAPCIVYLQLQYYLLFNQDANFL